MRLRIEEQTLFYKYISQQQKYSSKLVLESLRNAYSNTSVNFKPIQPIQFAVN